MPSFFSLLELHFRTVCVRAIQAPAMGATLSCAATGPPATWILTQNEVLEEIFLSVPHNQVVCVCRLVCRQWREVVDSESLWRERCRREGYRLSHGSKAPTDWRLFYFLSKKRKNLLKNPRGEDELKGWEILERGRNKWKTEELREPHPNEKVQTNFVTSYGMCRKVQLIKLEKEGYKPLFMDQFQPDIRVTDWYAALWDCGSEYVISVQLLNKRKEVVAGYSPDPISLQELDNQQWNQLIHVFRDYGLGVRYIRFMHGGSVRRYWEHDCGICITDTCIEICPAADS